MEELPYKLKIELAMEIHKDIYHNIEFFKYKERSFIVWVGPLLRPLLISEMDYIYKEGDHIKESKRMLLISYSILHGKWVCRLLPSEIRQHSLYSNRKRRSLWSNRFSV